MDQIRKLGLRIVERAPEEKKSGIERRVEEVVHEHNELEKKVRTKEAVSVYWMCYHLCFSFAHLKLYR